MGVGPTINLRVAIVAENASFQFGGEASLPLHYFSRLRERGVEAWLIVHGRTRAELDARFPRDMERILSIPDGRVHRLLWWPNRFLPRRVYGAIFGTAMEMLNQFLQRRMVRDLVQEKGVNLVHQPTPVSPKAPSFLCGLGVPVVIGPMNGGMDYPQAFRGEENIATRAIVGLGRRSAHLINCVIQGKRDAEILLVANERTGRALPACARGTVLQIAENGVDLKIWTLPKARTRAKLNAPRFLFIGRLVDWKRLDLVLHALVQVPEANLEVIGDGAMRAEWSALAESLGIGGRVKFAGWLPQKECAEHLQQATALLLPSIYECGGAVVLEAMATGTPVIATAWGGPADYVDESCGILVDPLSAASITDGFADAMRRLAQDSELREELGRAGRMRVEQQYDWEEKVTRMLGVYLQAMELHARESGATSRNEEADVLADAA